MAIMELEIPSGFSVSKEKLAKMFEEADDLIRNFELDGRKLIVYFDEVSSDIRTKSFKAASFFFVNFFVWATAFWWLLKQNSYLKDKVS